MALFGGKKIVPSIQTRVTVYGDKDLFPEAVGDMFVRRLRLAAAAVEFLRESPYVTDSAPLGDGYGMEEAVDTIRPLFARERSLTRWVALRGSLLFADMAFGDDGQWPAALQAMGMEPTSKHPRVAAPLSPSQAEACEGLVASLAFKLRRYGEIENMSIGDVNNDPELNRVNENVALDYIVWISIALLRTGRDQALPNIPPPGRIEQSGWYPEPILGHSERFHDGNDWTTRCRIVDGRNVRYGDMYFS